LSPLRYDFYITNGSDENQLLTDTEMTNIFSLRNLYPGKS